MSSEPVCAYPKLKQQQKVRFREKPALFEQKKLAPVLVKNWFGFWKTGPVVGKSVTDMGKSATDFGKKQFHFWEKPGRSLGQTAFGFGKKTARFGGKLVWFLDWLGTKLKSHCFERLACLGLDLGI